MKPKQQPNEPPRPAPNLDLEVSTNRCPFCHEGIQAENSVVCEGCLARHHGGCWQEGGNHCAACGGEASLVASQAEQTPAGYFPSHVLNSIFYGFSLLVCMPVWFWLKYAHDIERIGPVTTLVVPFAPLLIGSWITFALNYRRHPPQRRRLLAVVMALGTLVLVGILISTSLGR